MRKAGFGCSIVPGRGCRSNRGATMRHDDKRHGTTTLFAALNMRDGSVIGRNMQRHRHQEFTRFLNAAEREMPADKIRQAHPPAPEEWRLPLDHKPASRHQSLHQRTQSGPATLRLTRRSRRDHRRRRTRAAKVQFQSTGAKFIRPARITLAGTLEFGGWRRIELRPC